MKTQNQKKNTTNTVSYAEIANSGSSVQQTSNKTGSRPYSHQFPWINHFNEGVKYPKILDAIIASNLNKPISAKELDSYDQEQTKFFNKEINRNTYFLSLGRNQRVIQKKMKELDQISLEALDQYFAVNQVNSPNNIIFTLLNSYNGPVKQVFDIVTEEFDHEIHLREEIIKLTEAEIPKLKSQIAELTKQREAYKLPAATPVEQALLSNLKQQITALKGKISKKKSEIRLADIESFQLDRAAGSFLLNQGKRQVIIPFYPTEKDSRIFQKYEGETPSN